MSVLQELGSREEYFQMKFVEFLEMICRVALREHEREVLQGKRTQKKIYDVVYE